MMIQSQPASMECVHSWELCNPGYVCKGLSPGLRVVSEVKLMLDGQWTNVSDKCYG
jgi:hypothetical protein